MPPVLIDFEVGDHVKGRNIDYMNKIGRIVEVIITGRVTKLKVLWGNDECGVVLLKDVWKVENYELNQQEVTEDYNSDSSDESDVEVVPYDVSGESLNGPEVAEIEEFVVLPR